MSDTPTAGTCRTCRADRELQAVVDDLALVRNVGPVMVERMVSRLGGVDALRAADAGRIAVTPGVSVQQAEAVAAALERQEGEP